MQVYKEKGTKPVVIFHGTPLKDYPGGVAVDPSELALESNLLKKGTLLYVDWANKKGHIVKTAELYGAYTDASDDHMKVKKNQEFLVSDYVTDGTNEAQITSIDTTNADYDKLIFGAAASFGVDLAAGDIVEQGDGAAAYKYTPNAVASVAVYVEDRTASNIMTGAAINAKVIEDNLPYPLTTSASTGSASDQKGTLEPQITFL